MKHAYEITVQNNLTGEVSTVFVLFTSTKHAIQYYKGRHYTVLHIAAEENLDT
jgi:hypothetical protein